VFTVAQRPQALEKTGKGRHDSHVSRDWLEDHGGNLFRVAGEDGFDRGEIVVASQQCVAGCA
jgi:hypothetical protein